MLAAVFEDCAIKYCAPQLARKVMESRKAPHLNYGDLCVKDLKKCSPDQKRGLDRLPQDMPVRTLEEVFEVNPFWWSMHYCLWESALASFKKQGKTIEDVDVGALAQSLLLFTEIHGFAPSPAVLLGVKAVRSGSAARKRRREMEGQMRGTDEAAAEGGAEVGVEEVDRQAAAEAAVEVQAVEKAAGVEEKMQAHEAGRGQTSVGQPPARMRHVPDSSELFF